MKHSEHFVLNQGRLQTIAIVQLRCRSCSRAQVVVQPRVDLVDRDLQLQESIVQLVHLDLFAMQAMRQRFPPLPPNDSTQQTTAFWLPFAATSPILGLMILSDSKFHRNVRWLASIGLEQSVP